MRARQIATSLLPPVLADVLRHNGPFGKTWEGVYPDFASVPRTGPGFDGEEWVQQSLAAFRSLPSTRQTDYHSLLSFLVAATATPPAPTRILDFGGNVGLSYMRLKRDLAGERSLEYHVVESASICRLGRELLSGDDKVHFLEELPAESRSFDIVYLSSSLQYVEDYRSLLSRLAGYKATYVLLTKLSAGDIDTFATAQLNVPGSVIPYWFTNLQEIIGIFEAQGYALVFKSTNDDGLCPRNLPKRYRLARTCNVMFRRQS